MNESTVILSDVLLLCEPSPMVRREIYRVRRQNSRARKVGQVHTLTVNEWLGVLYAADWCCAFCGGPYECVEHVVRLADGGGTTVENCAPSCLSCNWLREKVQAGLAGVRDAVGSGRQIVVADLLNDFEMVLCEVRDG